MSDFTFAFMAWVLRLVGALAAVFVATTVLGAGAIIIVWGCIWLALQL